MQELIDKIGEEVPDLNIAEAIHDLQDYPNDCMEIKKN
mgnify:CR=1 FL=1